jgi:hypothetical protein
MGLLETSLSVVSDSSCSISSLTEGDKILIVIRVGRSKRLVAAQCGGKMELRS